MKVMGRIHFCARLSFEDDNYHESNIIDQKRESNSEDNKEYKMPFLAMWK